MNLKEPVSGRQFAKMVGQTEGAVRKAVTRGLIVKGKTPDGKFIPLVASDEWGKDILPEYLNAPTPVAKPKTATAKKILKEKPEAVTADQVTKEILAEKVFPKKETASMVDLFDEDENEDPEDSRDETNPSKISRAEAERRTAIHKSEILKIALAEKQAQMIPREKIATILFGYGQEIRVSFEGLTNKVLDRMLAAETRHEAKRILDEEIHATLTSLADIPNRNL